MFRYMYGVTYIKHDNTYKIIGGIVMRFCEGLTLILIVVKLLGIVNISWWLVFSPIWVPILVFMIAASLVVLCDELQKREKK